MKVKTSLEGEPLPSEEGLSCSSGGEEVEMDEADFEGETTSAKSPSEGSANSCRSKSSKTNVTIKPCKVLLKNIDCELKPPHKYGLIPPKTQKIRNAKKNLKLLRVALYKLWDKHHIETPWNPSNPAALPENTKLNEMESGLVLNSSAKIPSKETNTDDDVKKAEREARFPDSSMLCGNILTKFSFIKSNPAHSAAGFCHAQENKKEAESLQEDPVLIPETQNTVSFEPSEKCMEHGKTLIEQTQKKESSDGTDMLGSKCSGETSTDSTSQSSRINMIPVSPGDTLPTLRTNSAGSSAPSLLCEFEPYLISSLPGSALKIDLKDKFPRKNTVKRPVERGNSQPTKERLAGEEDRLLLRQSHGVRTVCYELSGSTVKLLGIPRDSSVVLSLDRLIELEDSSDWLSLFRLASVLQTGSQVQTGSHSAEEGQGSSPSQNEEKEGSPYSTELTWHQPVYSDDTRAMKSSTWRPDRRRARICSSELYQEESRIKVVDALREVLQKRLDDSPDLSGQESIVPRIAKKVERALFNLSCCVDQHYKKKYRSLIFNLKSAKNQHLFRKVILGEICPKRLVQMNALELAPEELAEWRASERKHALEVIEKEEREAPRCCLTKFTHKGIVEIVRESDEDLMFQEIFGSQLLEDENSHLEAPAASMRSSRDSHKSQMLDFDCFSETGQMAADDGFEPPTCKRILKQKTNVSKCLQSNAVYSGGGERRLQEDSAISLNCSKKHLRVVNRSRTSVIWKGLIQMFSLKQFAAKAYPVSGSSYHLFQALPDLLQSRGCILQEDVWAYIDSIWPASSKEMALIKFHPSLTKGRSPYKMLYCYLNNKQRYGIVDSNRMEMFMVPLAAYQPVPSKLHPLGGPGLDPCHPSLLLGLILPKRPPTGPDPSPKTKRKRVTFKDSIEVQYFPLPSQVEAHQMQPPPPLSLSDPLGGHDGFAAVLQRCEPLLSEEPVSKMVHESLSSLHQETAGGGINESLSDLILQFQCDFPEIKGQLGNLTLETLGTQSHQAGICTNPGPLHLGNPLGLLLSSETVCSNHRGEDGPRGTNLLDASHLLNMLCPETVPLAEVSEAPLLPQIPSATPVAGDTDSLVEETLLLTKYVTQLQSHVTPNQEPPPSLLSPFFVMPLETTSALSPATAGLEFLAVQQSDEVHAQLQLLLSSLRGETQLPST